MAASIKGYSDGRIFAWHLAMTILFVMLGGCSAGDGEQTGQIATQRMARIGHVELSGSATMSPLLSALARKYEALHPGVKVDVVPGDSAQGIAFARGRGDSIGMVGRNLADDEQDLQGYPIARHGIALMVSTVNPVPGITERQLALLLEGKLDNWSQLGGEHAAIQFILPESLKSSKELAGSRQGQAPETFRKAQALPGDASSIIAAATQRHTITFISLVEGRKIVEEGAALKLLRIDGNQATAHNVRKGTYSLSRPLNLVTRLLPEGETKLFINFCLSAQATDLISQYGFIPYFD